MLQQRLSVPLLSSNDVTTRTRPSDIRHRRYPPSIHVWETFEHGVRQYAPLEPERFDFEPEYHPVLLNSIDVTYASVSEADEQNWLVRMLSRTLKEAKILRDVQQCREERWASVILRYGKTLKQKMHHQLLPSYVR